MRVVTASGSTYEFEGGRMRRVNETDSKRADGEWVQVLYSGPIVVGAPLVLVLESLSGYGPDDAGQSNGGSTSRVTTAVTAIFEGDTL